MVMIYGVLITRADLLQRLQGSLDDQQLAKLSRHLIALRPIWRRI